MDVRRIASALVESPRPLALLRIVVPLVIVASPELYRARELAADPARLVFVPEGLIALPLSPEAARILQVMALSAAATSILGWMTRASLAILTVCAGLLFSLSQREGAVVHDMHLFWMTALLAASPSGDVWSVDAWGKTPPAPSFVYGVPLTIARLFLGVVYFFPGLHKLRVSGLAWTRAENIVAHMHAKWLEHGAVPAIRIDHAPTLCAIGGVFVVAFELSFLVLALVSPRTRWIALAAGLAFHWSTQLFFFIPFVSLWACYVVLIDGRRLERIGERERAAARTRTWWLPVLVGAPILAGAIVQGARAKMQAWPIACYPTFAYLQPPTVIDLAVDFTKADGSTVRLTGRERAPRSQEEWGRVFRLAGAYGDRPDEKALRAYAGSVARDAGIGDVVRARVYRVAVSTAPEAWSSRPEGERLLIELEDPL